MEVFIIGPCYMHKAVFSFLILFKVGTFMYTIFYHRSRYSDTYDLSVLNISFFLSTQIQCIVDFSAVLCLNTFLNIFFNIHNTKSILLNVCDGLKTYIKK